MQVTADNDEAVDGGGLGNGRRRGGQGAMPTWSIWEEGDGAPKGRENMGREERGRGEKAWGPQLARQFWLAKVGPREEEFGQPNGHASLLECVFYPKLLNFNLQKKIERLLEMLRSSPPPPDLHSPVPPWHIVSHLCPSV